MKWKLYKVEYEILTLKDDTVNQYSEPYFHHSQYLIIKSRNIQNAEHEAEQELQDELSRKDDADNYQLLIHSTEELLHTKLSSEFIRTAP